MLDCRSFLHMDMDWVSARDFGNRELDLMARCKEIRARTNRKVSTVVRNRCQAA